MCISLGTVTGPRAQPYDAAIAVAWCILQARFEWSIVPQIAVRPTLELCLCGMLRVGGASCLRLLRVTLAHKWAEALVPRTPLQPFHNTTLWSPPNVLGGEAMGQNVVVIY